MMAASKAEMDRYKRVKAQQRKIQKTLLERVEKILFEQLGTTAEERETAAKAKRGRQFRKKHQDKTRDETSSSDSVPEHVVAKADNVQQSIDGTELGFDMQYGLHGSGNTVFLDGNGFAEGPAIDDGNYTTEFSPREDMYPSQDEQLFESSSQEVVLLPHDPTLTEEGVADYSIVVAGSFNAAAFKTNTSLARVRGILHNVLCSPVTGPFVLITVVVSVMIRIVIAVL